VSLAGKESPEHFLLNSGLDEIEKEAWIESDDQGASEEQDRTEFFGKGHRFINMSGRIDGQRRIERLDESAKGEPDANENSDTRDDCKHWQVAPGTHQD
jgi:hypothetical protein